MTEREDLKGDGSNNPSGSFSAHITGLSPETKYYYQAYVREWNETTQDWEYRKGNVESFITAKEGQIIVSKPGYLVCGEIPAVSLSGTYESEKETFGDTYYHSYGVSGKSGQKVVTHTFANLAGRTLRNYTILYDKDKKAALWAAYAMNADLYPWSVDRSDSWDYDPGIPDDWQPYLKSSYTNNTRGHQVASNDRRTTTNQTKQTTYFSNMTPQIDGFNSGVWSTNEGKVQELGKKTTGRDTLYVVTGPIFGSNAGTDTDNKGVSCPVPTQFYKCVMKVTFDASGAAVSAQGAAYLFNHQSGATRQDKKIDEIETLTGFDFFTNIPSAIQEEAESNFTKFF